MNFAALKLGAVERNYLLLADFYVFWDYNTQFFQKFPPQLLLFLIETSGR